MITAIVIQEINIFSHHEFEIPIWQYRGPGLELGPVSKYVKNYFYFKVCITYAYYCFLRRMTKNEQRPSFALIAMKGFGNF